MVQNHRSTRKSSTAVDVSTARKTLTLPANKHELSSSPRFGYELEVPSSSSLKANRAGSSSDRWHYNNMVNNNRQEFNNLHFC